MDTIDNNTKERALKIQVAFRSKIRELLNDLQLYLTINGFELLFRRLLIVSKASLAKNKRMKSVYYSKKYSESELKYRNDMAISILEDYVLMIDD